MGRILSKDEGVEGVKKPCSKSITQNCIMDFEDGNRIKIGDSKKILTLKMYG